MSEQLALLSTSSKGLLEGDGEDQQDYGVGHQDPPDVVEHQEEQVQQGLDEKMIGESELSSPESSLVETEDIPGDFERCVGGCRYLIFRSLSYQVWRAYKRGGATEKVG